MTVTLTSPLVHLLQYLKGNTSEHIYLFPSYETCPLKAALNISLNWDMISRQLILQILIV